MCCPSSTPTANSAADHRGSGKSLFDRLTLATIWFEAWTGPPSFWFSNGSRLTTRNRICVAKIPSAMRGRFSSSASQTRHTDETRRVPLAAPMSWSIGEKWKPLLGCSSRGAFSLQNTFAYSAASFSFFSGRTLRRTDAGFAANHLS